MLSTKLSIEDYNAFLILTKFEYEVGLIKEPSTSELLRFTIRHILNQLHNNLIYPILEEEQEQRKKLKTISSNYINLVHSLLLLKLISTRFLI